MNFYKVWRIAQILLISQLRASVTSRNRRSFIRRPMALVALACGLFVGAGTLGYVAGYSFSKSASLVAFVRPLLTGAIITLPAVILALFLVLGLVLEVSGSSQAAASDTINWLPVTAAEYVLGSIIMLIAYYSIIPALLLGATMSLSFVFGLFQAWELAVLLSILGILVSSSVLEIIRAVLNRFSSSFYKRGGRSAIAARAIFGIMVIVVLQILFYPTFYERIIGTITANLGPAWFIPVLWSSVSVAAFLTGQALLAASFALLFAGLSGLMLFFAILARSKYWVPMPASVRISNAAYTPRSGSPFLGFLNPSQLAITRKDLRGLVRRREMTRFLALPFVFLVSTFLGLSSSGFNGYYLFGFFIITMTTSFISIAGLGSEGKSILNLYQYPLSARDFIIGKGATPAIFSSIFAVAFFLATGALSSLHPIYIVLMLIAGISLVLEMTALGMTIGTKFPYFAESTRSTFMSQSAGLIGFPLALVLMGLSLGPFLITVILRMSLSYTAIGFTVSLAITLIATYILFRVAVGQARNLLAQIPGVD
ncbi:MAG: hypothetical protein ACYC7D_06750 [Nitrososphaerales archaeon]